MKMRLLDVRIRIHTALELLRHQSDLFREKDAEKPPSGAVPITQIEDAAIILLRAAESLNNKLKLVTQETAVNDAPENVDIRHG